MIKSLSENHLKTRNLWSASFTWQHPGRKEGPRHSFSLLSKSLSEYRKIGRVAQNLLNSVWLCFRSSLGASEHWNPWASLSRYLPSILPDPLSLNGLPEVRLTALEHLEQAFPTTWLFLLWRLQILKMVLKLLLNHRILSFFFFFFSFWILSF